MSSIAVDIEVKILNELNPDEIEPLPCLLTNPEPLLMSSPDMYQHKLNWIYWTDQIQWYFVYFVIPEWF